MGHRGLGERGNVTFPEDWIRVKTCVHTVLEDPLHIEPVGGAGFIVGAAFEVVGQFSGPAVFDHSGVG